MEYLASAAENERVGADQILGDPVRYPVCRNHFGAFAVHGFVSHSEIQKQMSMMPCTLLVLDHR